LALLFGLTLYGCCGSEPKFPVIWQSNEPLTKVKVTAAFKGLPPQLETVSAIGELRADEELAPRLREAGLWADLERLPASQPAEVLLWETRCTFSPGQLVIGVFDPASGQTLAAGGKELFYSRVSLSH
jgi:hypothetical protein